MPWMETDVLDQRMQFVIAASRRGATHAELCRAFNISRKTGYKWLRRHRTARSVTALIDRSRRPHRSPGRTSAMITARVVALREAYGWAGEKLAPLLDAEGIALAADASYAQNTIAIPRADVTWQQARAHVDGSVGLGQGQPIQVSFTADTLTRARTPSATRSATAPV